MNPEQRLRTAARFRKSRHSGAQDSCVAIGTSEDWVGVQDTKEHPDSRQRTTLAFSRNVFTTFLNTIKNGHYDQ